MGQQCRDISFTDTPKHREGRVNGTRIVLVAAYCEEFSVLLLALSSNQRYKMKRE
ncbi:MAG: hypothetical protein ACI9DO_002381 [Reinekea sp.]|jgi:hypothetical protein